MDGNSAQNRVVDVSLTLYEFQLLWLLLVRERARLQAAHSDADPRLHNLLRKFIEYRDTAAAA